MIKLLILGSLILSSTGCAITPRSTPGLQVDLICRHTHAPDDWKHLRCNKSQIISFSYRVGVR